MEQYAKVTDDNILSL